MTTREDLTDLMMNVLDGLAGPEGERRLAAHLERDRDARELFEDLRAARRALEASASEEMPGGLREEILAGIRGEHRARLSHRPTAGGLAAVRALFSRRPVLALVPVFAMGAIAGALLLAAIDDGGLTPGLKGRGIEGTMHAPGGVCTGCPTGQLTMDGMSVAAWRGGENVTVRTGFTDGGPRRLEIAFDAAALEVSSVRWLGEAAGSFDAGSDRVQLEFMRPGDCDVDFRARRAGSVLFHMKASGEGGEVHADLPVDP